MFEPVGSPIPEPAGGDSGPNTARPPDLPTMLSFKYGVYEGIPGFWICSTSIA